MNRKNAFYFLVSLILTCGIALAQQPASPPDAPPTPHGPGAPGEPPTAFSLFIQGGSFLGVHSEDVNKENMGRYNLREARGVGITEVVKDSPAEKAGLRKDDVILRFEGDSVTSVRKLTRLVSEVAPDQNVRLTISRGGAEQEVAVTIGKRNNSFDAMQRFDGFQGLERLEGLKGLEGFKQLEGMKGLEGFKGVMPPGGAWKWEGQGPGGDGMVWAFGNHRRIGVNTMELTKQLADYFGVSQGTGVLVTGVSDDSPAAKAGIKAGDVIIAIDGDKVDGAGDLTRSINKKKDGDVNLTIIRNKNQRSVTVTPKAATPGDVQRIGRRIVIPRVELGKISEMDVHIGEIDLPSIPEINVNLPGKIVVPKVRVIRTGSRQPI